MKNTLQALLDSASKIQDTADAEGRPLTDAEQTEVNNMLSEFDKLSAAGETRTRIQELRQSAGRRTAPQPIGAYRSGSTRRDTAEPLFRDFATGQPVNAYRGTAPIDPQNDAPLGEMLRALLLNDTSGLSSELRASLSVGSDSAGGYLTAPAMSQRVVDLARANSVCMQAGALTVPMSTAEMTLARITGDPTATWRGETQAVTASRPTFGRFTLRPKMLAAIVPVSMELLEDAGNAGMLIEQSLTAALGTEVDRAILAGTGGGNEPLGILNTSGVNAQTAISTLTDYDEVSIAVRDILAANYPGSVGSLSWILHPVTAGVLDRLVTGISSDNTPLRPTPWAQELRRYYTTHALKDTTTSPNTYRSIVGAFGEVLVGMRTSGVIIDVLDAGSVTDSSSETWNAASQFLRLVRARIRVDVLVMRPGFFSTMTGIAG